MHSKSPVAQANRVGYLSIVNHVPSLVRGEGLQLVEFLINEELGLLRKFGYSRFL